MKQLTDIMSRLRSEGGCPWDRQQTIESLKQYLVEECYELIDAINSGDPVRHKDELSDLLLQVLFQAQIRKEEGKFTFEDVMSTLVEKLVRRHPHVFGNEKATTTGEVLKRWEEIKVGEKRGEQSRSVVDGIPRHLPALMKAQRVQERAARVGFDWDKVNDVIAKIDEELAEARQALAAGDRDSLKNEIGDLLFAVVNLCRFQEVNAEEALDEAVRRFVSRFQAMEERVRRDGKQMSACTLAELDAHWETVKQEASCC